MDGGKGGYKVGRERGGVVDEVEGERRGRTEGS
jgi:hypothetical protein